MSVYGTGQRFLSPEHEKDFYDRQRHLVPYEDEHPVIVGPGMLDIIGTVDGWLDSDVAPDYQEQPLAQDWARTAKVAEEAGEAVSALIACTGQNPRKGVCGTQDEVLKELGDAFCAAVFAIQHFTKDAELTADIVETSLIKALNRATGATVTPGSTTGAVHER